MNTPVISLFARGPALRATLARPALAAINGGPA